MKSTLGFLKMYTNGCNDVLDFFSNCISILEKKKQQKENFT